MIGCAAINARASADTAYRNTISYKAVGCINRPGSAERRCRTNISTCYFILPMIFWAVTMVAVSNKMKEIANVFMIDISLGNGIFRINIGSFYQIIILVLPGNQIPKIL